MQNPFNGVFSKKLYHELKGSNIKGGEIMAKCYCPDCVYSSYDEETDLYYCGISGRKYEGSNSASCSNYKEK
jgi:hypothetical protein